MLTPQQRREIGALAMVDDRTIRKAYRGDEPMNPTVWGRIAAAAKKLGLPALEPLRQRERVAG